MGLVELSGGGMESVSGTWARGVRGREECCGVSGIGGIVGLGDRGIAGRRAKKGSRGQWVWGLRDLVNYGIAGVVAEEIMGSRGDIH